MQEPRYPGPVVADASLLGQSLHFGFSGRSAPNRFLKAAMTERLSSWHPKNLGRRGVPTHEIINAYWRFGDGGIGTILTGNIMIDPVNIEGPGNLIVPGDAPFSGPRFQAYQDLARAGNHSGSLMVGQISHPGRQVQDCFQKDPVSASTIGIEKEVWGMKFAKPHAATHAEIRQIVADFTHAAEYLSRAGFDGVQLHGAHGYLLSQFLSQRTNERTDEYGGSLENRARIIVEIVDSVRAAVPASTGFVLGIKLNSVEFDTKGFSPEECALLCRLLEQKYKFDFIELSGGTYEDMAFEHKRESTKNREAFFLEFAEAIVPQLTKTKVFVTGGLRTVSAMVNALDTVDGIGLGRPLCAEPSLPRDIIQGRVQTGSIRQKISEQDYGLSETVAGTQIRQMGQNREPMDLTREDVVEAFQRSMKKWEEKLANDDKMEMYGYVDVEGVELPKYDRSVFGQRL